MEACVFVDTVMLYRYAAAEVTDSSSFSASLQKRKLKTLELNANTPELLPGENILLKWPDFPLNCWNSSRENLKTLTKQIQMKRASLPETSFC